MKKFYSLGAKYAGLFRDANEIDIVLIALYKIDKTHMSG